MSGVSFSLQQGEILGLLGPNGAGKTTTLNMLLGLLTPTSGDIRVFGKDLNTHRYEILSRVNFTSAYLSLPQNLSVWENMNVFAGLYGVKNKKKKVEELLSLLEIPDTMNKVVGVLSSGQRTRLNLCKALLNDPELLFLDEPTASLDPDIAEKIREILKKIKAERNVTMIYTSHNMREVELVCDRVLFLSKGKVITQGTPSEVIERSKSTSLEEVFISIARTGELLDTTAPKEEP